MHRPRLSETEFNQYQLKKLTDKRTYKLFVFSDPHGWLADLKCLRVINNILQHNKFDEVCINGDIVDLPFVSKHTNKLFMEGILKGYNEVEEFRYTEEQILKPLRLSTDAKITIRTGNHDERVTKPFLLSKGQLARLAILYKHFESTKFEEMLHLAENDMVYDPTDVFNYFDIFDITHGLSLTKNASEKNIIEYWGSGCTGHSHRLGMRYIRNRHNINAWFEVGCTRLMEAVEYLPTGKIADWCQGFLEVTFKIDGDKVLFFAQPHAIIDYKCVYNGVLYGE
jgi:predicted phosphodiesterase